MGLTSALNAAVSGLRVTQAGIDLVSQNVANADSVGYTRRRMAPVQALAGDRTSGVRTGEIERVLDMVAQRQLRLETSGAGYTSLAARYADAVDRLFGEPGGDGSLDGALNDFTGALQRLAANPGDYSLRANVLDLGGVLAGRVGSIAEDVQALRTEAEGRIGAAVTRANELLSGVASLNARVVAATSGGTTTNPALLDERDRLVTELSSLVDVQTSTDRTGSLRLSTTGGQTLFDGVNAVRLTFDGRGALGPNQTYSADEAARGVGTIKAVYPNGATTDLIANGSIRSGEIAAALELRDQTLVAVQRQLDELAAGMASALGDRPDLVAPATVAGFTGYDLDLAGFARGNAVTLDFRDPATAGGAPGPARRILIVPTNGGAPVITPPVETSDPSATVIRADVSGGLPAAMASIGAELAVRFPGRFATSTTGPSTLRVLGPNGTTEMVGAGITVAGLASGQPQLPFFVDRGRGDAPYTGGALGSSQLLGFAQRVAVNPQLVKDRSRLVVSDAGVPQGDAARPQFLLDALTKTSRSFSAATGIDGLGAPYASTVSDFARRVVEAQGARAETAQRLDAGQKVALSSVEGRFAESAAVNIDQEMAQLVQLQTAYGANARVMTAVRDMMDLLLRI